MPTDGSERQEARRPFHGALYDLGATADGRQVMLAPLQPGEADILGNAFAGMDPWAAYRIPAGRLAGFFAASEEACSRHAIRCNGRLAGAIVVRSPWLHGPYLQFLGLLPGEPGRGVGALALTWMEREAAPGTRNLWLCVSEINVRARNFYERHGYALAATLDGLAADHMPELLMRKRLRATTD